MIDWLCEMLVRWTVLSYRPSCLSFNFPWYYFCWKRHCCVALSIRCTTFSATFIRLWERLMTECCSRHHTTITTSLRSTTVRQNWAAAGGTHSARSGCPPPPAPPGSAMVTPHSTRWRRFAWWSSYSDPVADHCCSTENMQQTHEMKCTQVA